MHHPKQQDAERGQALAEFALTIPIFLMLVFGIIDLARLIAGFTQVIDAARQGVRYGIVEGLDADITQYLDCDGITDRVQDTAGIIPTDDLVIDIRYLRADGSEIAACPAGLNSLPNEEVSLEVTVTGAIAPMTPAIAIIDNNIDFSYTSERTITEGAYYTDVWPVGPPVPHNFRAQPDGDPCVTGRISFSWDPMDEWPDRIEIRDSYTNKVVASLDHPDTQYSTCNDYEPAGRTPCGTNINPNGGSGMWYAVAISDGLEGTSTSDDTANCKATPGGGGEGGTVTINIFAYDDLNRNGSYEPGAGEGPWPNLRVELFLEAGKRDVSQGTSTTDANGNVTLTGTIPGGQSAGTFYVHGTRPPGQYVLRVSDDITFSDLADGNSATGSFGVGGTK